MAIREIDVMERLKKEGKQAELYTPVWAVKMPSALNMVLFGSMAVVFDMRYNILNVSKEEIMLIGVSNDGKLREEFICFSKEEVQTVKVKKGAVGYDVVFDTDKGEIKYRVNKIMIGGDFQKRNVEKAIDMLKPWMK